MKLSLVLRCLQGNRRRAFPVSGPARPCNLTAHVFASLLREMAIALASADDDLPGTQLIHRGPGLFNGYFRDESSKSLVVSVVSQHQLRNASPIRPALSCWPRMRRMVAMLVVGFISTHFPCRSLQEPIELRRNWPR